VYDVATTPQATCHTQDSVQHADMRADHEKKRLPPYNAFG
jgi:hypothetical protein